MPFQPPPPPNRYLPGQGVRFSCPFYQSGELTDPDLAAILIITWPDGTTDTPTLVHDGTGLYHADVQIPPTMQAGPGFARWYANDSNPNEDGRGKREFTVVAP